MFAERVRKMFVGHESRNRDRFGHRRAPDENPRDYYYNHQNVMRLDRNLKGGAKIWPRKHEERDHLHPIEHQKHRSSRTPIDDYGYRAFNHPYTKYPEHHRFRSRSRSPFPPWLSQHRREFSDDRRHERRREVSEIMKPLPPRKELRRSSEHRSVYSNTKHSEYSKAKGHAVAKVRSNLRHASKWMQDSRDGSRSKVTRSRPLSINKRHSLSKSKGSPRGSSKKKSLSRVSSSDFKSSPSTEHLEKQKKYLVDRLAEYEQLRRGSPLQPASKPKSPQEENIQKEEVPSKRCSPHTPGHSPSSPSSSSSSSSLQSFDAREEGHHFNINFPNDEDDDADDPGDEELLKTFEPIKNPEFVKMIPPLEFRPLFIREEFKRKKEDGLKEEEKAVIKDYRKNGLKKDSSENKKFFITQTVVENTPDTSENHEPLESELLEVRRDSIQLVHLPRKFAPRQNHKKVSGEGFDLRQRIHERLQNKQAYEQLGNDVNKSYPSSKEYFRRPDQIHDRVSAAPMVPIRRVVSDSRSIGLVSTFSNGSSQPKRSVVLTRRPIATSRFLQ